MTYTLTLFAVPLIAGAFALAPYAMLRIQDWLFARKIEKRTTLERPEFWRHSARGLPHMWR